MLFREATKTKIIQILDSSPLTVFAFTINYPTEVNNKKSPFEVLYIGDKRYYLRLSEDYNYEESKYELKLKFSPGIHLDDEPAKIILGIDSLFSELRVWLDRVYEDLRNSSPLLKTAFAEISRLEAEFENKINEKINLNDLTYFSHEEITEISKKIDNLYSSFEKLKNDNELKEIELKSIKQELEKLKTNITVLPKNAWLKTGGKKILTLIGKYVNPETFKSLSTEIIKGLLD